MIPNLSQRRRMELALIPALLWAVQPECAA